MGIEISNADPSEDSLRLTKTSAFSLFSGLDNLKND